MHSTAPLSARRMEEKGTKAQPWRPESGWLERKAPELAIVDADLWQRVGSM